MPEDTHDALPSVSDSHSIGSLHIGSKVIMTVEQLRPESTVTSTVALDITPHMHTNGEYLHEDDEPVYVEVGGSADIWNTSIRRDHPSSSDSGRDGMSDVLHSMEVIGDGIREAEDQTGNTQTTANHVVLDSMVQVMDKTLEGLNTNPAPMEVTTKQKAMSEKFGFSMSMKQSKYEDPRDRRNAESARCGCFKRFKHRCEFVVELHGYARCPCLVSDLRYRTCHNIEGAGNCDGEAADSTV